MPQDNTQSKISYIPAIIPDWKLRDNILRHAKTGEKLADEGGNNKETSQEISALFSAIQLDMMMLEGQS